MIEQNAESTAKAEQAALTGHATMVDVAALSKAYDLQTVEAHA